MTVPESIHHRLEDVVTVVQLHNVERNSRTTKREVELGEG